MIKTRLSCNLCERPPFKPDGLQTWSDALTEHLLVCSIRATDNFLAREQPVNPVNNLGIHFKVMVHTEALSEALLFVVERRALDPHFCVYDPNGFLIFRTPNLDQLVDFFRDEHGIPLPSLRG